MCASVRDRHLSLRQLTLTAVREGSGQLVLREIEDRDLGVLFEHSRDRDAIRMAAFTSPDSDDRTNFERRWARLRSDGSTTNRVVEIDGRVVGHIASFDLEGQREVTYWIGREDWGRGIATRALQEFLQLEATRPLYARRCERQRRVDSCVDEVRFPYRGRGARVRSWAQRGNGRGRPPTRCMTPTALGWASVRVVTRGGQCSAALSPWPMFPTSRYKASTLFPSGSSRKPRINQERSRGTRRTIRPKTGLDSRTVEGITCSLAPRVEAEMQVGRRRPPVP